MEHGEGGTEYCVREAEERFNISDKIMRNRKPVPDVENEEARNTHDNALCLLSGIVIKDGNGARNSQ